MKCVTRLRRSAWLIMLGLMTFSLATAGVRLWVGSAAARKDDSLSLKLAHFEANKDSYTSLFIGNSRIYRGINPALFDQTMAEAGHPSKSYNFGIPAMTEAEINKVVRQMVSADPCCVNYVFVELWSPAYLQSVRANRTVASYDLMTAWFAVQHTIGGDKALATKATRVAEIVAAAGLNVLNVGSLLHTLPEYVASETPLGEDADAYQGYTRLEDESSTEIRQRREKFVEIGEGAFEQLVAEQQQLYETKPPLKPYQEVALTMLAEYVAQLDGAELVFVVMPFGKSYDVNNDAFPVFDYNDVSTYPELFEPTLWFDEGHLTAEGALWLTRDLAQQVIERASGAGH